MAKKTLKKKVQGKQPVSKLSAGVVDSARDIWLAGLGALSVAQEEGGRLLEQGNKLFDKLVAEGARMEKKARGDVEGTVDNLRGDVESRVDSVRRQAADNWDKLESIFEDRVARVLGRLGVPTSDDVNELSARVQKLSEQVAALVAKQESGSTSSRGKKKTASRKSTTRKKATSRSARAKSSS